MNYDVTKMTEIDSAQNKKLMIEELLYIDKVCKENHLRYYLAYGTLLGAVRHQGFIPWDDDVDILMPRPDYEKLISLINCREERSKYKVLHAENNRQYNYPFAKLINTDTFTPSISLPISTNPSWSPGSAFTSISS